MDIVLIIVQITLMFAMAYMEYDAGFKKGFKVGASDSEWVEVKTRPATVEEYALDPTTEYIIDCKMPDNGEAVLVTLETGTIETDIFWKEYGEYSDGGFFETYDISEVLAWTKMPKPYKRKEEG